MVAVLLVLPGGASIAKRRPAPRRGALTALTVLLLDASIGVVVAATLLRFLVAPSGSADWRGWIDLSRWPPEAANATFLAFACGVLGWPLLPQAARAVVRALVLVVALLCLLDTVAYWSALRRGDLAAGWPIPLSLPTALALGPWSIWASSPERRPRKRRAALTLCCTLPGIPLALALFVAAFGATDYRRSADAVVVFGARVYPDGRPTLSLADRTATGCQLVLDGLAPTIVYSGGRDEGNRLSEAESMYEWGAQFGVMGDRVVFDDEGHNTAATVHNVAVLARERGWRRVLLVSHDYHLARIKLFAEREGLCAYTVPAAETRPLAKARWFFVRELAAIGYYWFEPLWNRL